MKHVPSGRVAQSNKQTAGNPMRPWNRQDVMERAAMAGVVVTHRKENKGEWNESTIWAVDGIDVDTQMKGDKIDWAWIASQIQENK